MYVGIEELQGRLDGLAIASDTNAKGSGRRDDGGSTKWCRGSNAG